MVSMVPALLAPWAGFWGAVASCHQARLVLKPFSGGCQSNASPVWWGLGVHSEMLSSQGAHTAGALGMVGPFYSTVCHMLPWVAGTRRWLRSGEAIGCWELRLPHPFLQSWTLVTAPCTRVTSPWTPLTCTWTWTGTTPWTPTATVSERPSLTTCSPNLPAAPHQVPASTPGMWPCARMGGQGWLMAPGMLGGP